MAKVRVYELAKELNVESKELVEKLKAGGLNIKNYMSTLDEDLVKRAKDIVRGVTSEVIEEKRIKPTVIRRRKKVVKVEAEKPEPPLEEEKKEPSAAEKVKEEAPSAEEVSPKEPELPEEKEKIKKKKAPRKKKVAEEKEAPKKKAAKEAKPDKPKAKEKAKAKKKVKKKPKEQPAKIIALIIRVRIADCAAQALHFQEAFFPDDDGRDKENEKINNSGIPRSYLTHNKADCGIETCEQI